MDQSHKSVKSWISVLRPCEQPHGAAVEDRAESSSRDSCEEKLNTI
jgi:hypothetical protein